MDHWTWLYSKEGHFSERDMFRDHIQTFQKYSHQFCYWNRPHNLPYHVCHILKSLIQANKLKKQVVS